MSDGLSSSSPHPPPKALSREIDHTKRDKEARKKEEEEETERKDAFKSPINLQDAQVGFYLWVNLLLDGEKEREWKKRRLIGRGNIILLGE